MVWRTTKRAETSKPVTKRTASERGKLSRRVNVWTKLNHVTTRTKQMKLDTREKKIRTHSVSVTVVGATTPRNSSFLSATKKKRVTEALRQRLIFAKGILLKKVPRILMASMQTMCFVLTRYQRQLIQTGRDFVGIPLGLIGYSIGRTLTN
ncbi:hypothetical protein BG842_03440 [Haladaptatus sp. W1]|nr:hypothetical protein BG842_03440 [Haladaptatus sp. W1]